MLQHGGLFHASEAMKERTGKTGGETSSHFQN